MFNDLHRWVNWRMEFVMTENYGYVKLYKDGFLLGGVEGTTVDRSIVKNGPYVHLGYTVEPLKGGFCEPTDATIFFKNFEISQVADVSTVPMQTILPVLATSGNRFMIYIYVNVLFLKLNRNFFLAGPATTRRPTTTTPKPCKSNSDCAAYQVFIFLFFYFLIFYFLNLYSIVQNLSARVYQLCLLLNLIL